MSSYFVCITISRRHVSFEYHQEGANISLAPFPSEDAWPVPLALYCTESKIEIGRAAEHAAARGVLGAFKEWFQQLSSGEKVNYLGQPHPVSHLLLLAAEEQFRSFLKDVRYNIDGGLENCRASMPLVLSFEDDVDDAMRIFLVNLFKNNGYGRVYELYHNRLIAAHHDRGCRSGNLLIVDSDGVDLTLSLYMRGQEDASFKRIMLKAGVDPRLQSVCNMIWKKTGADFTYLDRETEQARLEQMAAEVIEANQVEFEGMMHYSDGERLAFLITRSELSASGSGNGSVALEIAQSLEIATGLRPEDITVVLRNFAVKSDYFRQTLGSVFPSLISHDENSVKESNRILVDRVKELAVGGDVPAIQHKSAHPGPVTTGSGNNGKKESGDHDAPTPLPPPPDVFDPKLMVKMGREMRAVRANINAKFLRGDKAAASIAYKELLASWGDNAPEILLVELHEWLGSKGITREELLSATNQTKPSSPPKRSMPDPEIKKRRDIPKPPSDVEEKILEKNKIAEGERLLKSGNFNEAKRFFAGVGNEYMKQLCIDLLRDSRDLKALACQNPSSLSPTARKNNQVKLKRILTNYRKAGLDTESIEELIIKFK